MQPKFIAASSAFKSPTSSLAKVAIAVTSVLLMSSTQVFAQTWDGGGPNSNFNTAANWSGNTVPAASSNATINGVGGLNQPVIQAGDSTNALNLVTISAGSLRVNGTLTASAITVSGSGTLNNSFTGVVVGNVFNDGNVINNGSILGNVTNFSNFRMTGLGNNIVGSLTNSGGFIDLGASQHEVNGFTQHVGSILRMDLSDNTSSSLVVNGAASLGGALNLDFSSYIFDRDVAAFEFDLLTVNGTVTGQFGSYNLLGLSPDLSLRIASSNLQGVTTYSGIVERNVVTSVPEPETYAMMLAGLGLVASIARRRKAKSTA